MPDYLDLSQNYFPCPTCHDIMSRWTRRTRVYNAKTLAWEREHSRTFLDLKPYDMPRPRCEDLGFQTEMLEHVQQCKYHKKHTGNGTYSGPFAFTLTKSPYDALTVNDMLDAVEKVMNQKSCPVAQYAWYLEHKGVDENGLPAHSHIHGMYETHSQGRIEAKHFKRAWPIWNEAQRLGQGFRGGYHRPVKAEECYKDYIKKDGGLSKCRIQPDE